MAMEHAQSGYDELQTWVTTAAAPAVVSGQGMVCSSNYSLITHSVGRGSLSSKAEHANLAGSHARKLYDAYAAQHGTLTTTM